MFFEKWFQRLAFNHFISGNYVKAEGYFERLLKSYPGKVGMRHNLALVKLALGKFEEAVDLLKQELERFGEEYHRLRSLGDACYLWGRADEAARWYRQALEPAPSEQDRSFLAARLEICGDQERFRFAQEGKDALNQGVQEQTAGNNERAKELFALAVSKDPTNFMARNNLGSIYMNLEKDYARAAEEFSAALEYTDLPLIQKNLQLCRNEERKHHAND